MKIDGMSECILMSSTIPPNPVEYHRWECANDFNSFNDLVNDCFKAEWRNTNGFIGFSHPKMVNFDAIVRHSR